MQSLIIRCIGIAVLVFSGSATTRDTRTIEIPTGKTGEIQVGEIISRLAKASGVAIELPAAGMTLATQGLAGPLTRTLLSEALGPEVTITFRPGVMTIAIDEQVWAAARRDEWLGRLRNLGERAAEAGADGRRMGCVRSSHFGRTIPSVRPSV